MTNQRLRDTKSIIAIPLAIVIAGGLIAGAIFMTNNNSDTVVTNGNSNIREVKAVTSDDHIMGNPDAKLIVVEYSDTECPFCKNFHNTMRQIMQEHGSTGDVAWVYRHFPLDNLHKKARNEALATECVASIGGENAFWKYINQIFDITPANDKLDPAELLNIAKEQGIDEAKFTACMADGSLAEKVESDYQSGLDAGVEGTPYSIILVKGSQTVVPIDGAQPYSVVSNVINTLLNK
jgi:protein-disulfide isomerase